MNDRDYDILSDLASSACDGPLSEAELATLQDLLGRSDEAKRLWTSYARLHTHLFLQTRAEGVLSRAMDAIRHSMDDSNVDIAVSMVSSPTESDEQAGAPSAACLLPERAAAPETRVDSRFVHYAKQVALVAASLLLGAMAWQWLRLEEPAANQLVGDRAHPGEQARPADETSLVLSTSESERAFDNRGNDVESEREIVARIVRKVDCDWEGDRWTVNSSAAIAAGQNLVMSRGLMELEFRSGARVTLEAPVSFTVENPMRAVLSRGKLTAVVPEQARGFTVVTPEGDAIDLGTEFGVFVGDEGETETHVFRGEVSFLPGQELPKGQPNNAVGGEVKLTDDMALRLEREPVERSTLAAANLQRFTRVDFAEQPRVASPIVDRELRVWFAADHRVQLDEQERVTTWGDILTASNVKEEDAWQVQADKRPRWVSAGIGERPALEFTGEQLLVTEPMELESNHSLVAVIRPDLMKARRRPSATSLHYQFQIINLNGPPNFVLRLLSDDRLACHMYVGRCETLSGRSRFVKTSDIEYQLSSVDVPMVVAAVHDPANGRSRLYCNGVLSGEDAAIAQGKTTAPRYIGDHMYETRSSYVGLIAEVMIYSEGLSDIEVRMLSEALMEKYAIAESHFEP